MIVQVGEEVTDVDVLCDVCKSGSGVYDLFYVPKKLRVLKCALCPDCAVGFGVFREDGYINDNYTAETAQTLIEEEQIHIVESLGNSIDILEY